MEKEYKDVRVRILVIDDHVILRQGIRELLDKEDDFEVVGEAGNEIWALTLTTELKPDIVLVDFALDHSSGMNIAKQLLRSSPNTRIVLYAGPNAESPELGTQLDLGRVSATCSARVDE